MKKMAAILPLFLVVFTVGCGGSRFGKFIKLIAASARGSSDDAANAARRTATRASGHADDAVRGAGVRGVKNLSQAAWTRLSGALDDAIRVNNNTGQLLTNAASRLAPRSLAFLQEKFQRNQAALQSEADRAQAGYQSDAECDRATARIQRLSQEQAAIASLIEKMG